LYVCGLIKKIPGTSLHSFWMC